jgi:creatinine amidohydrolase
MTLLWSQRTWAELPHDLEHAHRAALLPVGATEQHGPHLGCGTDLVIAEKLCASVSERIRVPMLPPVAYGCSAGHSRRWPGTLSVQPVTLIHYIKDIGDWAYYNGVRRLFIVNSHVTNAAPLRCALDMLRTEHDDLMVALVNTGTLSARVREVHFADGDDWHANDAETSLMLARAPEMVRGALAAKADDPDRTAGLVFAHPVNRTSRNGVTGAPSKADRTKGELLFEWMVEDLAELVRSGMRETPPLDVSYFNTKDECR